MYELILIKENVLRDKHGKWHNTYKCFCGNEFTTNKSNIKTGNTRSCGCLLSKWRAEGNGHRTHGMFGTRTYKTWESMLRRCRNPKSPDWKWYGGRGITVCQEWSKFENFYLDMGDRPENKTIDRIDNELGYFKENCRWATASEQVNNRRSW